MARAEQSARSARLARAAIVGLTAGLLVASAALVVSAVTRLRVNCATLSQTECALETELAGEGARVEAFAALGCLLAGAGLFLRLRRPKTTSAPTRS